MCSKKPLTDAERLLHEAFKGLLLKTDSYKIRHWRQYPPEVPMDLEPEGPEDVDDPVDREREE